MVLVVPVTRETLQNPPRDVDGRRIKHGVVIGKGHVLEHHAVVVFVERGPAPFLHCIDKTQSIARCTDSR